MSSILGWGSTELDSVETMRAETKQRIKRWAFRRTRTIKSYRENKGFSMKFSHGYLDQQAGGHGHQEVVIITKRTIVWVDSVKWKIKGFCIYCFTVSSPNMRPKGHSR